MSPYQKDAFNRVRVGMVYAWVAVAQLIASTWLKP